MPFNSFEYLIFFLVTFVGSLALIRLKHARIVLLLLASWFFYISNNTWVFFILFASIVIDYFVGIYIEDTEDKRARKRLLLASVITNLSVLGFFKYSNFFIDNVKAVAESFGVTAELGVVDILLPVGISFYTFQSMSYSIDVYYREIKAERSFVNFAFYVSFFPQLVAGPIVRARHFLYQIPWQSPLNIHKIETAIFLICTGLIKKFVFADTLGDFSDAAFDSEDALHAFNAWLGLMAFTFQIYFDFSGYTDVAIGCALLFGFRLPPNFKRPYVAVSFSDFWRRWHISLSSWLRDYLYKPLGGNRHGSLMTYRNLILVMLFGGLWHGASWTFVLWGALHGTFLAIERLAGFAKVSVGKGAQRLSAAERLLRSSVIFLFCALAWLPFRANSFEDLQRLVSSLFNFDAPMSLAVGSYVAIGIMLLGYAAQWLGEKVSFKRLYKRSPLFIKTAFIVLSVLLVIVFSSRGVEPFIYFRF